MSEWVEITEVRDISADISNLYFSVVYMLTYVETVHCNLVLHDNQQTYTMWCRVRTTCYSGEQTLSTTVSAIRRRGPVSPFHRILSVASNICLNQYLVMPTLEANVYSTTTVNNLYTEFLKQNILQVKGDVDADVALYLIIIVIFKFPPRLTLVLSYLEINWKKCRHLKLA